MFYPYSDWAFWGLSKIGGGGPLNYDLKLRALIKENEIPV